MTEPTLFTVLPSPDALGVPQPAPVAAATAATEDFAGLLMALMPTAASTAEQQSAAPGEAGKKLPATGKARLTQGLNTGANLPDRQLEEFAVEIGIDRELARLLLEQTGGGVADDQPEGHGAQPRPMLKALAATDSTPMLDLAAMPVSLPLAIALPPTPVAAPPVESSMPQAAPQFVPAALGTWRSPAADVGATAIMQAGPEPLPVPVLQQSRAAIERAAAADSRVNALAPPLLGALRDKFEPAPAPTPAVTADPAAPIAPTVATVPAAPPAPAVTAGPVAPPAPTVTASPVAPPAPAAATGPVATMVPAFATAGIPGGSASSMPSPRGTTAPSPAPVVQLSPFTTPVPAQSALADEDLLRWRALRSAALDRPSTASAEQQGSPPTVVVDDVARPVRIAEQPITPRRFVPAAPAAVARSPLPGPAPAVQTMPTPASTPSPLPAVSSDTTPVQAAFAQSPLPQATPRAAPTADAPLRLPEAPLTYAQRADAFAQQVGQRLLQSINSQQWSLSLRVEPANLGPVDIALQVNGRDVAADISVASATVQSLLEQGMPTLRQSLETAGLQLSALNLSAAAAQYAGPNANSNGPGRQPERSAPRTAALRAISKAESRLLTNSSGPADASGRDVDLFV